MTRREWLRATTALLTAGLAACSSTANGVVLQVSQIDNWGQAFINAAKLLAPLVAGPAAGVVTAALTAVSTDLAKFDQSSGGSVTLTFDRTSVPAAISSLLNDGKTLATDLAQDLGGTISSEATIYLDALNTIVSTFAAAIGSVAVAVSAARRSTVAMTETEALAILKVQPK